MLEEAITSVVCDVFSEVLGGAPVSPHDDFFADLGGDSLKAAVLATTLEAAFGLDVIEDVFASSDPASLAAVLAAAVREGRRDPALVDLSVVSPSVAERVRLLAEVEA